MASRLNATTHSGVFKGHVDEDRQIIQVMKNIVKVFPEPGKLLTLMMKTRTGVAPMGQDRKHNYQYMGRTPTTVVMGAAASSSATSLTLESNLHIIPGQTLQDIVTGEQLFVSAVNSNGTGITVGTRGSYGGGTAGALALGQSLLVLPTSVAEGATALESTGIYPDQDYNYFQQFETDFELTDIVENILHYGTNPASIEEEAAFARYKQQMARAFLFGYRNKVAASGSTGNRYWVGGAREFIEGGDNIFDANGAFTYAELSSFMLETVREGQSAKKIGLGSRYVGDIMSRWALDYHQADATKTSEFGLDVMRFKGAGWRLDFFVDDCFEDAELTEELYILDIKYMKHLIARNMPDRLNRDITGPKKDGSHTRKHQLTGVHTQEFHIPNAHAIVRGITG